jgi:hypothetical protein
VVHALDDSCNDKPASALQSNHKPDHICVALHEAAFRNLGQHRGCVCVCVCVCAGGGGVTKEEDGASVR